MKNILSIYKPVGITPLQVINQLRKEHPAYAESKLGYAGRLDPMADGLLLILVGDENKNRKKYEDLSKEYVCEVLLGIATDTYDILGKITDMDKSDFRTNTSTETVQETVSSFIGKQIQPYPPYSSQPVNGKPLYYWARNNKLEHIEIPTKRIEIYTITVLSQRNISSDELQKYITQQIAKVTGDFRQEEIRKIWDRFFEQNNGQTFPIFRFSISCSSGTYIRSFAHNLGKKLQTSALALSITRTKVGDYNLQDTLKLATL